MKRTIKPETIELRKKAINELVEYYGSVATDMKRSQEKYDVYDDKAFDEAVIKHAFLSNTKRFFTYLELEPHISMNIFVKARLETAEDATNLIQRDFGANHLTILGYNTDNIKSYKLALKNLIDLVCMHGQDPHNITFIKMIEWSEDGVDMLRRENMARLYKNNKWRYELTQVYEC